MKHILFLYLLIVSAPVTIAQQTPQQQKPLLPPGALVKRAPEMATWTLTFVPTDDKNGSNVGGGAATNPTGGTVGPGALAKKIVRMITVVKTGHIYYETETDSAGKKWEKWHFGNQLVISEAGSDQLILAPSSSGVGIFTDYSASDFPDMSWISAQNYTGVEQKSGVACYVFRDKVIRDGGVNPVDVIAAVDGKTLRPASFTYSGLTGTYTFGAPPQAELSVPDKIQKFLAKRQKAIDTLMYRPH